MAQRFFEQATSQIAPVYDQQIQAAQSQIPAINKLYEALTSSLQQGSQADLQRGVQGIVEDASARGVLRSTLPVDARTQLQGEISRALAEGMANIGRQRLSDITGLQERVGNLQQARLGAITNLADTLQQQDIREREFAAQQEASRRAAAAQAQQNSAFELLMQRIQQAQAGGQPTFTAFGNRTPLDQIFGTSAPQLRVTNTQAGRLQPAGQVNVQPTAAARTFQPAAPTTRTRQPRLQGAGAVRGTLRVR